MITEKAVKTLYKCFNFPEYVCIESLKYHYDHGFHGEEFWKIKFRIQSRLGWFD